MLGLPDGGLDILGLPDGGLDMLGLPEGGLALPQEQHAVPLHHGLVGCGDLGLPDLAPLLLPPSKDMLLLSLPRPAVGRALVPSPGLARPPLEVCSRGGRGGTCRLGRLEVRLEAGWRIG